MGSEWLVFGGAIGGGFLVFIFSIWFVPKTKKIDVETAYREEIRKELTAIKEENKNLARDGRNLIKVNYRMWRHYADLYNRFVRLLRSVQLSENEVLDWLKGLENPEDLYVDPNSTPTEQDVT